jgi:hypothetical protein
MDLSDIQVTQIVLVDAITDEDIPGAFDCSPVCTNDAKLLNIRAETMDGVQSVRFSMVGPITQDPRVENAAPWALFRDNSGDFEGVVLKPGEYTVTAEPFSESGALGVSGPIESMTFSIADPSDEAPSSTPSHEPFSMPSLLPSFSLNPSTTPSDAPSSVPSMGPSQQPSLPPAGWSTITFDDFESGWGSFMRASDTKDAKRQKWNAKQGPFIYQGLYALRIKDNEWEKSSVYHRASYDVREYSKLRVKFSFCARSMESREDFYLEYSDDGGTSWNVVRHFEHQTDFDNDQCYRMYDDKSIELTGVNLNTSEAKLRFRSHAGNGDFIYIDEVLWEGYGP